MSATKEEMAEILKLSLALQGYTSDGSAYKVVNEPQCRAFQRMAKHDQKAIERIESIARAALRR